MSDPDDLRGFLIEKEHLEGMEHKQIRKRYNAVCRPGQIDKKSRLYEAVMKAKTDFLDDDFLDEHPDVESWESYEYGLMTAIIKEELNLQTLANQLTMIHKCEDETNIEVEVWDGDVWDNWLRFLGEVNELIIAEKLIMQKLNGIKSQIENGQRVTSRLFDKAVGSLNKYPEFLVNELKSRMLSRTRAWQPEQKQFKRYEGYIGNAFKRIVRPLDKEKTKDHLEKAFTTFRNAIFAASEDQVSTVRKKQQTTLTKALKDINVDSVIDFLGSYITSEKLQRLVENDEGNPRWDVWLSILGNKKKAFENKSEENEEEVGDDGEKKSIPNKDQIEFKCTLSEDQQKTPLYESIALWVRKLDEGTWKFDEEENKEDLLLDNIAKHLRLTVDKLGIEQTNLLFDQMMGCAVDGLELDEGQEYFLDYGEHFLLGALTKLSKPIFVSNLKAELGKQERGEGKPPEAAKLPEFVVSIAKRESIESRITKGFQILRKDVQTLKKDESKLKIKALKTNMRDLVARSKNLPKFISQLEELIAAIPSEPPSMTQVIGWQQRWRTVCEMKQNLDKPSSIPIVIEDVKDENGETNQAEEISQARKVTDKINPRQKPAVDVSQKRRLFDDADEDDGQDKFTVNPKYKGRALWTKIKTGSLRNDVSFFGNRDKLRRKSLKKEADQPLTRAEGQRSLASSEAAIQNVVAVQEALTNYNDQQTHTTLETLQSELETMKWGHDQLMRSLEQWQYFRKVRDPNWIKSMRSKTDALIDMIPQAEFWYGPTFTNIELLLDGILTDQHLLHGEIDDVYWIEKAARGTQSQLEGQRSLALSETAQEKWDDVDVALDEYADDKTAKLKAFKSELTKLSQIHAELESSLKQWQFFREKGDSNLFKPVRSRTERLIDSLKSAKGAKRADPLSVVDIQAQLDSILDAQNVLHKEIETRKRNEMEENEEWKAEEDEYNIEPRTVSNKTEQQVTVSKNASQETTIMNDKKKSRQEMTADARIEDPKFEMFYDIVRLVKKQNEAEKVTSPKKEARHSEKITVKRQNQTTMPKERPKPGRKGQLIVLEDNAGEDEGRRGAEKTVQHLHKVVKAAYNELKKLETSENAKEIRDVKSHIDNVEKRIRRIKSKKWGVRNKVLTSDEKTLRVRDLSQAVLDQWENVDDLLDTYATSNPEKKKDDFVRLASAMRELLQKHLDLKLALERFHINIPDLTGVTSQIKALMSNLREAEEDKFGEDFDSLQKNLRFINQKIGNLQTLKEVVKEVDENDEDGEQEAEKVQEDEEPEVNEDEQGDAQETTKASKLSDLSKAALEQWNAVNALFDGRASTAKVASLRVAAMADLLGKQRAVDDAIDKSGKKKLKTGVASKIETLISKMKAKEWETFFNDFKAIRDELITGYTRIKKSDSQVPVEPPVQAKDKKGRGELRKNAKKVEDGARKDEDEEDEGEDEERSDENVTDREEVVDEDGGEESQNNENGEERAEKSEGEEEEEQSDEESEKDEKSEGEEEEQSNEESDEDGEDVADESQNNEDEEEQAEKSEGEEEAKAPSLRDLSRAALAQWNVVDKLLARPNKTKQEIYSQRPAMAELLNKQYAIDEALKARGNPISTTGLASQIDALIAKFRIKKWDWGDFNAVGDILLSNDKKIQSLEKVSNKENDRPIKNPKKSEPLTIKPGKDSAKDKKARAKISKKAKQEDANYDVFQAIVNKVRQVRELTFKESPPKKQLISK